MTLISLYWPPPAALPVGPEALFTFSTYFYHSHICACICRSCGSRHCGLFWPQSSGLTSQPDLGSLPSLLPCLGITRLGHFLAWPQLCSGITDLPVSHRAVSDPHLQTDFSAWPWTCLIVMNFLDDLVWPWLPPLACPAPLLHNRRRVSREPPALLAAIYLPVPREQPALTRTRHWEQCSLCLAPTSLNKLQGCAKRWQVQWRWCQFFQELLPKRSSHVTSPATGICSHPSSLC